MSDATPQTQQPSAPPPPRPRLRDRVVGMRAVVAVGLAGLVLGGAGGTAVGAVIGTVAADHDGDHSSERPSMERAPRDHSR